MSMKRKASALAALANSPEPKRRRMPSSAASKETAESTTAAGMAVIDHLKIARDKKGNLISTDFLTLPDRKEFPEYYEVTLLPLSIEEIEAKLKNHEYPTMTTFESDLKRMVQNAKDFNEKTSDIHGFAEKIRKLVSNHMVKINPAYSDPRYAPFPTPLPVKEEDETKEEPKEEQQEDVDEGAGDADADADAEGEPDADGEPDASEAVAEAVQEKKRPKMILHGPRSAKDESALRESARRQSALRASSTPAVQGAEDAGESFDGNTFQQAQEKLITELMEMTDEEGTLISGPFINLPPRDLRDYYQVVKNPISLRGVQKRIRGVVGREKPTGVTLFKSWQALENEIRVIWENARTYNEDGSAIYQAAGQLEAHFNRRLAEAKAVVPEPSQPKVTLRMTAKDPEPTAKVKLHLTSKSAPVENKGTAVDAAALKRQQDLVAAGANGQVKPVNDTSNASQSPVTRSNDRARAASDRVSVPPTTNGIKPETNTSHSPAPTAAVASNTSEASVEGAAPASTAGAAQTGSMPPPSSTTPRVASGSPHPQAALRPTTSHTSLHPLDNRFRPAGKGVADALIKNVFISTHPALRVQKHFKLAIPPNPRLSQQNITITLPRTHDCLCICPTLAAVGPPRQSAYFCTVNNTRLAPVRFEENDQRRPVYETRLMTGINYLHVEMLSGLARGAPKSGPGPDIEFEKTTIFVNVVG